MKTTCMISLALMAVASYANPLRGSVSDSTGDVDLVEDENGRHLVATNDVCPYGGGVVLFNVETTIIPGGGATQCNETTLASIGEMISSNFVSAGISAMPGTTFVSEFCSLPSLFSFIRRKLATITGFVWKGGGGCKGCNPDNRDARRLLTVKPTPMPTRQPTSKPTAKPSSSSLLGSLLAPKPPSSSLLGSLLAPKPSPTLAPKAAPPPTSLLSTPVLAPLLGPQPSSLLSSLLGTLTPVLDAQNLFTNTFVSKADEIEAQFDAAVTTGLLNFPWMGSNPQVTVDVQIVQSQSDIQCIVDALLSFLSF